MAVSVLGNSNGGQLESNSFVNSKATISYEATILDVSLWWYVADKKDTWLLHNKFPEHYTGYFEEK